MGNLQDGIRPLSTVQVVPVAAVKPYGKNPRRIPDKAVAQCAESIREFGWQQPIVVDSDMVVLAGHTRLKAARSLGLTRVPVVVADQLTAEQARAFRIADNRAHDYATWDYPLLLGELDGLDEDFASVLDLADWRAVIEQFESAQDDAALDPGDSRES